MDVLDRADLPFPHSLPEFQRLFPDDAACAAYLEKARWGDGFACPHCGTAGEPFHFENRPGVLRCRKCRQNTGLTVGTVMERSHTPLNVWFWAAYLVASQTPGMSAVQFQRQLGLSRYETAFQILHKLRSGMVRPNQDRIGGQPKNHVEVANAGMGDRRGREHPWRAPLYPVCAHSSPSGCGCKPDRQAINERDAVLAASDVINSDRLGNTTHNLIADRPVYVDFTDAKGVRKKHRLFANARDTPRVENFFMHAFHGERAEAGLRYNERKNAFEVD